MPRILYRIVNSDPPSAVDFKSHAERGIRLIRPYPELVRISTGLSMFDDLEVARIKARGKPWYSQACIAEIALFDDSGARIEKTTSHPSHYTVWCDETIFRASIVRVLPIEEGVEDV